MAESLESLMKRLEDVQKKYFELNAKYEEYKEELIAYDEELLSLDKNIEQKQLELESFVGSGTEEDNKAINDKVTLIASMKEQLESMGDGRKDLVKQYETFSREIEQSQKELHEIRDILIENPTVNVALQENIKTEFAQEIYIQKVNQKELKEQNDYFVKAILENQDIQNIIVEMTYLFVDSIYKDPFKHDEEFKKLLNDFNLKLTNTQVRLDENDIVMIMKKFTDVEETREGEEIKYQEPDKFVIPSIEREISYSEASVKELKKQMEEELGFIQSKLKVSQDNSAKINENEMKINSIDAEIRGITGSDRYKNYLVTLQELEKQLKANNLLSNRLSVVIKENTSEKVLTEDEKYIRNLYGEFKQVNYNIRKFFSDLKKGDKVANKDISALIGRYKEICAELETKSGGYGVKAWQTALYDELTPKVKDGTIDEVYLNERNLGLKELGKDFRVRGYRDFYASYKSFVSQTKDLDNLQEEILNGKFPEEIPDIVEAYQENFTKFGQVEVEKILRGENLVKLGKFDEFVNKLLKNKFINKLVNNRFVNHLFDKGNSSVKEAFELWESPAFIGEDKESEGLDIDILREMNSKHYQEISKDMAKVKTLEAEKRTLIAENEELKKNNETVQSTQIEEEELEILSRVYAPDIRKTLEDMER